MTDKEKIRAEIERRMNKHKYSTALTEMVYAEEDENLLAFIDSLPEEPSCPILSDDLDKLMKEVQKYYSDNFDYITSDQPTLSILTNIARHFTEWQKRKMMEKAVEVDLKEEIASFFSKNPIPYEHITDWPLLKNTALHFFKLGKLSARKEENK